LSQRFQIYLRLAREKRLKEPSDWSRCTPFDLNIIPVGAGAEIVVESFRKLLKRVHANLETVWRWQQFRE
jgi:hypothetical protein